MARRRNPDKLVSDLLAIISELGDEVRDEPLGTYETVADRMNCAARALTAVARVEQMRWGTWTPKRLRDLSENELTVLLEEDAARAQRRSNGGQLQ